MLKPVGPRVLVKRLSEKKQQSSLIETVEFNEKPSQFAVVIAVGKLVHSELSPGNVVILANYGGAPVSLSPSEGAPTQEFSMMMEDDVIARVDNIEGVNNV